jgi:hypothetical protein
MTAPPEWDTRAHWLTYYNNGLVPTFTGQVVTTNG